MNKHYAYDDEDYDETDEDGAGAWIGFVLLVVVFAVGFFIGRIS